MLQRNRFSNVAINGYLMLKKKKEKKEKKSFSMSQQISFQCHKNEVFNAAKN